MATAAKKPAGTPASGSTKKPAAQTQTAASKAPAKSPAPASQAAPAVKAAPAKAPQAKPAAAEKQAAAGKPGPAKDVPPVASTTPSAKATALKPKPAAPAQTSAKPAQKQVVPAKPPARAAEKPAAASAPQKPMKANEAKTPPAKATDAAATLTEAEVQAMSDKDYMNEAQLAFFKAKLEAMRDEILENARETGEHLKENEVFADPNDRATVEEENLLEQRVRDRERKLLKKINASLARIEEGAYGYCLETGDPIGIPRLLARPTAELSIEAQEKHERLEKLYAD